MFHSRLLFLILTFSKLCFSQDTTAISKIDTLIPFFGKSSLNLYGYENRVVPYGSTNPLYVLITYKESEKKNFEYFRVDSLTYLVYEYFYEEKMNKYDGVKSVGIKTLRDSIIGTSTTEVKHIGGRKTYSTKQIHYFKEFLKEDKWEEYEDSVFNHIYWVGNYKHNKRIGTWKRMANGIGDDFIIEEIDYDKDSSKVIYLANLVNTLPIDSLQAMLLGRWHLRSCDAENEPRMFYSKCQLYDGHYGDDCNNKWAKENYYDFVSNTKFVRQRGEGCYKFRETCTNAQWKIIEKDGMRYLQIKYENGLIWKLKILYLDNERNLITDRQ